jgi:hypothetical protein
MFKKEFQAFLFSAECFGNKVIKFREFFSSMKWFGKEFRVGCALTFASEAKFEIEAKISFRFEEKKKPDFT